MVPGEELHVSMSRHRGMMTSILYLFRLIIIPTHSIAIYITNQTIRAMSIPWQECKSIEQHKTALTYSH